jgi:hypothetical protein
MANFCNRTGKGLAVFVAIIDEGSHPELQMFAFLLYDHDMVP